MSKIGRELSDFLSRTMSRAMILACQNVTNSTPVDTEHAASNWVLSIGSRFNNVVGSRESVSWAEHEAGIERVRNYDIRRDGPRIYLGNNVLYLQYLDAGWSQQAEAGFVARAIESAASGAPVEKRNAVHHMLHNMAHSAYIRTLHHMD